MIYRGDRLNTISFPLGGIGTGSIGLAGNGRLIDWEIFNRPNKGSTNGFTHFAIKAEKDDKVLDARILASDLSPPYIGEYHRELYNCFGFGPPREYLAGFPHFKEVTFKGEYPFAELHFRDKNFPGDVKLIAFNPLIPLDSKNSSIPAAFFEIKIKNTTSGKLTYTICLSLCNPHPPDRGRNRYTEIGKIKLVILDAVGLDADEIGYGNMCIATDADEVSYLEYWPREEIFQGMHYTLKSFWENFMKPGRLKNGKRSSSETTPATAQIVHTPTRDHASLAAHVKIEPGEEKGVRFVIAWYFPNCVNYWNSLNPEYMKKKWKNYYATIFKSSMDVALYALKNWNMLYNETLKFKNALFSSTLPEYVIDAVSSNLSILKSPTVLRLEDGTLYGFEGCGVDSGCCEGSCSHVWLYAIALSFLYPDLEKSMLSSYFKYCQREDGFMYFRLMLPPGSGYWFFQHPTKPHAAVDGQFGTILRVHRYWKLTGDDEWIKNVWPSIKKAIEFAWSPNNPDKWDQNKDGVLEGRQHHTLDMELFGPNAWLTGYYLAALKAAAEIAQHLGEDEIAKEYLKIFERGRSWVNKNLFNGEYYYQKIDLADKSILELFIESDPEVYETYWDSEAGEIRFQIGEGCLCDQLAGQLHANINGLGEIFEKEKRLKTLKAIFKYNFKRCLRDHFNPFRVFALNDEAGVVICEWPKKKPKVPIPYYSEVMPGFEYALASLMIMEGLIEEGLAIVRAIRERFDGEKRNPWNEFECGSNYARSLSSYALLIALLGLKYDAQEKFIGFYPKLGNGDKEFRCFWCVGTGWGLISISQKHVKLKVEYGKLHVRKIGLEVLKKGKLKSVKVNGQPIPAKQVEDSIVFERELDISAEKEITIELEQLEGS